MPPLSDVVPVLALATLLLTALLHPGPAAEATLAVAASAAVVTAGGLGLSEALDVVGDLAPVVVFLMAILVVSHVCDRAGLFRAAGALLTGRGGGAARLLTVAFLLAAAVTAVLSLDATVVLLTPVVLAAAAAIGVPGRPAAYACLRMANSASLLLPVSNLTNLLALPRLDLTFAGFAARMAPVLLVVLAVEYVGLRLLFRSDLAAPATPAPAQRPRLPPVPLATVASMLAGFVVTSPWGVDPAWVTAAAAVVLVAWAVRAGVVTAPAARQVAHAAHPAFALLVLSLGIVVAAVSAGGLHHRVADWLPDDAGGLWPLLGIAVLATGLACVLTNLSATLLLVPLVAPLGDTAVLAALLGLNIGSGLVLTGSLANLLWRRGLSARGEPPGLGEFHRVSLILTPASLFAAVATLSLLR